MSKLLDQFNKKQLKNIPDIKPGDVVKVYQKIKDGEKDRVQVFEGLVLAKKHGKGSKRLTISPELYIISTPLIYSTVDKVTTTDRTFSAFIGSGFDYQLTRRFKLNMNYKANLSTNPDFPILSFFLIGSKINL